ncbi:VWA domain-containing protein [Permianibacter sp. IMCC34836]|nr:VWA domain-containing protein [Permianibacter fluminis]
MVKYLSAAAFGVATLWSATSDAAGLLTPKDGSLPALDIRSHHVNVVIEDGYAVTTIEQVFHNAQQSDLEAIYSFPIPEKAAVGEFTYWIDGKPVHGEVMKKAAAKQIYQEEKQAGHEVALTEQDSYKTFDISVYPVRAQQDVKIRLAYIQPAHVDTGIGRYNYPLEEGGVDEEKLSFWTANEKVTDEFSFNLLLRSSYPIDQLRLPKHPNAVVKQLSEQEWSVSIASRGSNAASASATNGDTDLNAAGTATPVIAEANSTGPAPAHVLDQDIMVYWRLRPGLPGSVDLVTYKAPGSALGTFMMTVTPGDDLRAISEGRDFVFVLDYSGSMQGKYQSLLEGVSKGLQKLQANDRFRIVLFNDSARELTSGYVNATPEAVLQIIQQLQSIAPNGGTDLYSAIDLGMRSLEADRSSAIILVTDGVANVGVTEKKQFLKLLEQRDVRLFTFVMGNSANRPLLEGMAKVSHGFAINVSNSDDIVGKLLEATSKLSHEAFHDVELKIAGDIRTSDLTPVQIGSLYRGQQLIVFGHYSGSGNAEVKVGGKISGQAKTYATKFAFPKDDSRYPELERLWAFAAIEDLQAKMDYFGADADTEQAVTDLAIDHGLVTDYTSMIVLREEEFARRGIARNNAQRITQEHDARQQRQAAPVRDHRVDAPQPMYSTPAPSHSSGGSSGGGGGGGDTGPLGVLLLLPLLPLLLNVLRGRRRLG